MSRILPLSDTFGRVHTSLRVSVTDRCNIRCFYCMPERAEFLPRRDVLTFEEIQQIVKTTAKLGVNKIRLTGGEPLVRSEIWKLIKLLKSIDSIQEIALTTNGVLLADQADRLMDAGLDRLNISIDSVDRAKFEQITRRDSLSKVLAGIAQAQKVGFQNTKLNAVSIKGITETEVAKLAEFARSVELELRFIEFMPLDADAAWKTNQVLTGPEVRAIIEREVGSLTPIQRDDPSQPARDFQYADGLKVGFIDSVSAPFCQACNRLRLTAEGGLRNCLFSEQEWNLRAILRDQSIENLAAELEAQIRHCLKHKKAGHGTNGDGFLRPEKAMYQIGG